MPLERPARPPAGAITDRVRSAILAETQRRGLDAPTLLALHAEGEHLADVRDVVADLEERHQMKPGTFMERVGRRMFGDDAARAVASGIVEQIAFGTPGARAAPPILLELPETEFLTVVEHAIRLSYLSDRLHPQDVSDLFHYVDGALRAHGTPYRGTQDGQWRFEWIGDPKQHELTVQPALLALADHRLVGARAEFEEALQKRRGGTPKELEDAVDEAAKAVESILQVLHAEHGVTPPRSQQVTPLFNSLVPAGVLPGYVDKLIAAASGPRNNMASHGQGETVREVPDELAEASIAAAATAITFLAHYLP